MAMNAARTPPPSVDWRSDLALACGRVTNAAAGTFIVGMSERNDDSANEGGGWPQPSEDVLRELEAPALGWSEPDSAASWPIRRPARD
jgi:hypothetical protein